MAILKFRSRDRRQRDPFAAAPVAAPVAPQRFENPHGIATPETLAGIAAQAQAEDARTRTMPPAAPWGPWDEPGSFPAALHAGALGDEHGRWYGWDTTVLDNPPAYDGRPYIPGDLGRGRRMSPARAAIRDDLGGCLIFRDAVRAEFVRRDQVRGIRHDGGWLDSWTLTAERRLGSGYPELPDFRIAEMMHAHFAGMLAMHPRRAAA